MENINSTAKSCDGDIKNNIYSAMDSALDELVPVEVFSSGTEDLKLGCDLKVEKANDLEPVAGNAQPEVLDAVVVKALDKVKKYFLNSEMEEQKLAEFMLKILTLNAKDMEYKDFKLNPGILDKIVDQITENRDIKSDSDGFGEFLENLFGTGAAKTINENLNRSNVDEIVEKLLGRDTKQLICDRLESDNLDELLNKLIDEKLAIDGDPQAKHPNFDDFIAKILGEETKEFIRNKLESLFNKNDKNADILDVQDVD